MIVGVSVLTPVEDDGHLQTWRGLAHLSDQTDIPVLVVTLTTTSTVTGAEDYLQNEYDLRDLLDEDWALLPLAILREEQRMLLLRRDPDGRSIKGLLGAPMQIDVFLPLAIRAASTLLAAHARQVLHGSISPANLWLAAPDGDVLLTGFGRSTRAGSHAPRSIRQGPDIAALAYSAPELFGRMNRAGDMRSDLYALGATFYEMLTGAPPFDAVEPVELIHSHMARRPRSPSSLVPAIPSILSNCVMKLLSKNAEDRYQTAGGLVADLRRCLRDWHSQQRIDPFALAASDVSDTLHLPNRLYGRDRSVDALSTLLENMRTGSSPELALISGRSGVGKSALIREFDKRCAGRECLLVGGKFDRNAPDVPFSALRSALCDLIRQLLSSPEEELRRARPALQLAVGVSGRVMIDLVPELELVIGPQPPVPGAGAQEAERRSRLALSRMLGVFATAERPLVLVLDDLQWADKATLAMIGAILVEEGTPHLLIIGTCRDDEVDARHPLTTALDAVEQAGRTVHRIALSELARADVERFVSDAFRLDEERTERLTALLAEHAGGNPFFLTQLVTELVAEQLIRFDRVAGRWEWDAQRISTKVFTDHVAGLMFDKLARLSGDALNVLKDAACLGGSINPATVAVAGDRDEADVHAALAESLSQGLLVRTDDGYRFLHDRMQEAAYASITLELRAERHLDIGRRLTSGLSADARDERIFEVVDQLNRGSALIDRAEDRLALAADNLAAGLRARRSAAYSSAQVYFRLGLASLPDGSWRHHPQLVLDLQLGAAECRLLTGDLADLDRDLKEILANAGSVRDKARAYLLRIDLQLLRSEHGAAVESALTCLRLFGIVLEPHPDREKLDRAYADVLRRLDSCGIASLVDLPLCVDEDWAAAMDVLGALYAPACFVDETLSRLQVCILMSLTLEHGITDASTGGLSWFGLMVGAASDRHADGYQLSKVAYDLIERHGFSQHKAKALLSLNLAGIWVRPLSEAIGTARASFRAAVDTGDLIFACYARRHLVTDCLSSGVALAEVAAEVDDGIGFARQAKYADMFDVMGPQRQFVRAMRGRTVSVSSLTDDDFDTKSFEAALSPDPMTVFWYWTLRAQVSYIGGDFAGARHCIDVAEPLRQTSFGRSQLIEYTLFSALSAATRDDRADGVLDTMREHHASMALWARGCHATFAGKQALIAAEIARLEGRDIAAMRFFDEAIDHARTHGFPHDEALASEAASRFYRSCKLDRTADQYLRGALAAYLAWGATGKVVQIDRSLGPKTPPDAAATALATTADNRRLDLASIIKATQAVSSEILLPNLIERLMTIAVQNAGAVSGLFVLRHEDEFRVRAQARPTNGELEVTAVDQAIAERDHPASLLRYVIRSREPVILDDAVIENPFGEDGYWQRVRPRSVLCFPVQNQGETRGVLYLENALATHAFTPDRIAVLEVLATQAAISLELAGLYGDLHQQIAERGRTENELRRSEAFLIEGQRISRCCTWSYDLTDDAMEWSEEAYRIWGFDPPVPPPYAELVDRVHPDDRDYYETTVSAAHRLGRAFDFEFRIILPDGSLKHLWAVARPEPGPDARRAYLGSTMDITDRKLSQAAASKAQGELAHAARVALLGELTASIAHEVLQPLAGIVTNGEAGLRWLDRAEPNIGKAKSTFDLIVADAHRTGEVVHRLRAMSRKEAPRVQAIPVAEIVADALSLIGAEVQRHGIALAVEIDPDSPSLLADRIQIQQVLINFVMNAMQAIDAGEAGPGRITVRAFATRSQTVRIEVSDTGVGVPEDEISRLFETFYTTKKDGLGIGLPICRSIVEAHSGTISVARNADRGMVVGFELPTGS